MSLTQTEQISIVSIIQQYFGPDVKIWLYGPRLDWISNQQEVDLYIEASLPIINHQHVKMASTNELA